MVVFLFIYDFVVFLAGLIEILFQPHILVYSLAEPHVDFLDSLFDFLYFQVQLLILHNQFIVFGLQIFIFLV